MKTIIVHPKNESERQLVTELLTQIGVHFQVGTEISNDLEKSNFLEDTDPTDKADISEIIEKLGR